MYVATVFQNVTTKRTKGANKGQEFTKETAVGDLRSAHPTYALALGEFSETLDKLTDDYRKLITRIEIRPATSPTSALNFKV